MKKTLKMTALLLCAVAMVMATSCTKENGNQGSNNQGSNNYQSRILGKWKFTRIIRYHDSPGELIWQDVLYTSDLITTYYYDLSGELYMTLEKPNDWEYNLYFKTESLVMASWNIGQKPDDEYGMYSYTIDESELTIGYPGGSDVFNILELTNSKLVLINENGSRYEFVKVN